MIDKLSTVKCFASQQMKQLEFKYMLSIPDQLSSIKAFFCMDSINDLVYKTVPDFEPMISNVTALSYQTAHE